MYISLVYYINLENVFMYDSWLMYVLLDFKQIQETNGKKSVPG